MVARWKFARARPRRRRAMQTASAPAKSRREVRRNPAADLCNASAAALPPRTRSAPSDAALPTLRYSHHMTALRAFLPGGDDCAPHDERRLARCLVVDPCDGGRSSLLLQFAFNRALRGLRTLYVCASREGLAARPPVRPAAAAPPRRPPAPPPSARPTPVRGAAADRRQVRAARRGAARAAARAPPRRDGDAAHADHRRPARAAAAGGGGRRRRRGGAACRAPSPARPSPSSPSASTARCRRRAPSPPPTPPTT